MITARGLARSFQNKKGETVHAVKGVDFSVRTGEIVGFLGPNGAGKTTTLKMLTTLLKPTAGSAVVAGYDLAADPQGVRTAIGYVGQSSGTSPMASVREELVMQGECYRMSRTEAAARADELLRDLDLTEQAGTMTMLLSGGQRRRLDIALGLIHRPQLVFLDEPSTGLDPQSRNNLWDHIRRLRKDHGATVFLSTHYLDEADALCDRVLIIDKGRVVAEDSPEELKQHMGHDTISVEVESEMDRARAALENRLGAQNVAVEGTTLLLSVEHGNRRMMELLRMLDEADVVPLSVQVSRPSLNDVFLNVTGRSAEQAAATA
ncbi:ATP-binding cassette domain-containing protein [Amycolatopsis sp. NBC_00345]|uniref:ATP-binding cassette domain-containing protein n=1 Tax=Amycolatopsis sp. NBC_00345 TaxID=2975955 RepID=UPI002E27431E